MKCDLLQIENLPPKWREFYSRLTNNQKILYENCVSDLENNTNFMIYAKRYNKNPEDPYTDNMYATVNYRMCLLRDVVRLDALKLFESGRKREVIFDIGCGAGYFSYFAKKAGHIVYSLDAPEKTCGKAIFADGQKALGLDVILHTIRSFEPLPKIEEKISLAVSFSPHFYSPSTAEFWRIDEWKYFLKDLAQNMTDNGVMYFHLNMVVSRPEFGVFGTPETRDMFFSLGKVERKYIITLEAQKILSSD